MTKDEIIPLMFETLTRIAKDPRTKPRDRKQAHQMLDHLNAHIEAEGNAGNDH